MKLILKFLGGIIIYVVLFANIESCKKDNSLLENGGEVSYSIDTLSFDTVFTTLATATRRVKIYNKENKNVIIPRIYIQKGNNSFFRMNINGQTGIEVKNLELAAHDSAYIFVEANVDPGNVNNPFLVEDSIIAFSNGSNTILFVEAYGQDAYYYKDSILNTQTWANDKPHVLLSNCLVDINQKLTINAGTHIYLNKDAYLLVDGTVEMNGTLNDSIIFQGDRLDRDYYYYDNYPGEWGGIWFFQNSINNKMTHVFIKNATTGIRVDSLSTNGLPKLTLNKCQISNSYNYGLLAITGSIEANNCVFAINNVNVALIYGGDYKMKFCTMGGYSSSQQQYGIPHKSKNLVINDWFEIASNIYDSKPMNANFYNCIVYGTLDNEMTGSSLVADDTLNYKVKLYNCIIKYKELNKFPSNIKTYNPIFNQDPMFVDTYNWNFRLGNNSPAKDAGDPTYTLPDDKDDYPRASPPDLGCYEIH